MTSNRAVECLPLAIRDLPVAVWRLIGPLMLSLASTRPARHLSGSPTRLSGSPDPLPPNRPPTQKTSRVPIIPPAAFHATPVTVYLSQTKAENRLVKQPDPVSADKKQWRMSHSAMSNGTRRDIGHPGNLYRRFHTYVRLQQAKPGKPPARHEPHVREVGGPAGENRHRLAPRGRRREMGRPLPAPQPVRHQEIRRTPRFVLEGAAPHGHFVGDLPAHGHGRDCDRDGHPRHAPRAAPGGAGSQFAGLLLR